MEESCESDDEVGCCRYQSVEDEVWASGTGAVR